MMATPAACPQCGAKVRPGHARCPRCRFVLVQPDPLHAARTSRTLRMTAAGLGAAFLLVTGALWLGRGPEPAADPVRPRPSGDPLAARRQGPASSEKGGAPAAPARAFLDPSGAGSIAYAAGDYATALAQYQAAVERNPQDAESLSNLGQVLVRLNRPKEAIPFFERALAILPSRWAYQFNLARALGLTGQWAESVAAYRKAQALFPDDYATAFNLGLALHRMGDEAGAVEAYQKAISLEPGDPSFRIALGTSYERLDKPAEAAAAYREALRLAPDAPDADKVSERIAQLTAPAPPLAAATSGPGGH